MKRIDMLTAGGDTPALNLGAPHVRLETLINPGNLAQPYHSINTDVHKRIRYPDAGEGL